MDEKQLIFEQYKLYVKSKEEFTDRSFKTNRFYLVLALVLLAGTYILHSTMTQPVFIPTIIVCIIGMLCASLWWMNVDTYRFLIKIKLSKVIEVIEEKLAIAPHKDEYTHIQEQIEKKRAIFFSDLQKAFAVFIFCIYVIILINNVIFFFSGR